MAAESASRSTSGNCRAPVRGVDVRDKWLGSQVPAKPGTESRCGAVDTGSSGHILVAVGAEVEPEPTAGQPTAGQPTAGQPTAGQPTAGSPTAGPPGAEQPPAGTRLKSAIRIVGFDVVGPLIAYAILRKAGLSAVTALILSGVLPAIGVTANAIQRRRVDIIGAVVLAGIVVGAVVGLVSHNARLVLLEGSVPTAVFGVACLSSLRAPKPLLFGFAHEFVGPESARGREMTRLWQFAAYQHAYRVVTAVWGVGYLVEAGVRVAIVENTSTGTALAASKFLPYVSAAILAGWTVAYARYQWRKA
jgi:hypothetical protein